MNLIYVYGIAFWISNSRSSYKRILMSHVVSCGSNIPNAWIRQAHSKGHQMRNQVIFSRVFWMDSNHTVLPGHWTSCRVEVQPQVLPLFLCCSNVTVRAPHVVQVMHVCRISPETWDDLVVGILCVYGGILECGVSHSHQDMQDDTSLDDAGYCGRVMLHRSEENLPALCQNAEGIFGNTAPSRELIIEDSLLLCHLSLRIRFHHVRAKPKCVVFEDVVGCGSVIIW